MIRPRRLHAFPKQRKSNLLPRAQSYRLIFIFMHRAFCNSGAARVAPFDRPIREQRYREGRGGHRRGFGWSRSRGRAQGRGAWISRL